jgi:hypothetical protein
MLCGMINKEVCEKDLIQHRNYPIKKKTNLFREVL